MNKFNTDDSKHYRMWELQNPCRSLDITVNLDK